MRPRGTPSSHVYHFLTLFSTFLASSRVLSSDVSIDIASGAASQLVREALHQALSSPKASIVSVRSHERPLLASLAKIDVENRISYSNITLKFYPDTVHVKANNVRIESVSNVTPKLWPMSFSDERVQFNVQMGDVDVSARVAERSARVLSCSLRDAFVDASARNYWLVDALLSLASRPIQNNLRKIICYIISDYLSSLDSAIIKNISLWDMVPAQYRELLNATHSALLYYRVRSVTIEEKHAEIAAQLEWDRGAMHDSGHADNASRVLMQWEGDDRVTIHIDDSAINEMLEQIGWEFQWMEETIAVTSPVIPQSSREFLSTLCTSCYFLLNVWAKGPPVVHAVNGSIILEKRDRLNLRVVNPDRNVTSVFVSMILSINAELRPQVDSGIVRTLVQLLDTNVIMEKGAFPPAWALFFQDLVRGMILDMMWPEMKKQIEELTYSEGVRLAESCGVEPRSINIIIGEGRLGVTASLLLNKLKPQQCVVDLKGALPDTAKLFPQR